MGGMPLRSRLLVAAAVGAGLVALLSYTTGALGGVQRSTIDTRFAIRGAQAPDNGIVIVALDEQSLARLDQRPPIPRADYARILDRLHAAGPRLIAVDVEFIGRTDPNDDRSLLQALARDGPVLLATQDGASGPVPVPAGVKDAPGVTLASGSVDLDPDNVLRRMIYEPVALNTFAVQAAVMLGTRVSPSEFPDNHAWIDFRGPPGTFPTYSFASVLDGKVPTSAFAGKTVIVGVTDPDEKDVFVTPASSDPMSGVEIQANALSTILAGFPLEPTTGWVDVLLVLALAGLPAVLSIRLPVLLVLVACVGVLVAFLVGAQIAFNSGSIIDVPDPILALALGGAGAIAAESLVERGHRHALEEALGTQRGSGSRFFISYRHDQSRWPARILHDALVARFGRSSVFMDKAAIDAGQVWPQRIEEAIAECSVMLVLIGPQWSGARHDDGTRCLDSPDDWVRREVAGGLARDTVVVVPVLLDGAAMPEEDDLPDPLKALVACHAISLAGEDPDAEIGQLVDSIQKGQVREHFARQRRPTAAP
jgi:CHASE2 domain-containing sensor protein